MLAMHQVQLLNSAVFVVGVGMIFMFLNERLSHEASRLTLWPVAMTIFVIAILGVVGWIDAFLDTSNPHQVSAAVDALTMLLGLLLFLLTCVAISRIVRETAAQRDYMRRSRLQSLTTTYSFLLIALGLFYAFMELLKIPLSDIHDPSDGARKLVIAAAGLFAVTALINTVFHRASLDSRSESNLLLRGVGKFGGQWSTATARVIDSSAIDLNELPDTRLPVWKHERRFYTSPEVLRRFVMLHRDLGRLCVTPTPQFHSTTLRWRLRVTASKPFVFGRLVADPRNRPLKLKLLARIGRGRSSDVPALDAVERATGLRRIDRDLLSSCGLAVEGFTPDRVAKIG